MLRNTGIETRLKAILEVPGNELCSECEKPDHKVEFASFFVSPVDARRLGVLCCKKCVKLHDDVGEGEFFTKNLEELDDWSEEDVDALEVSGNKIINESYEATAGKEKVNREKRKYGAEAYYFEKFVNRTYFDQLLYKQLVTESSKSVVEMRVNRQLRGFNVKKMASENSRGDTEDSEEEDEDQPNDEDEVQQRQRQRDGRRPGLEKTSSVRNRNRDRREGLEKTPSIRDRREGMEKVPSIRERRILQKKRLSSRNLLGDILSDEKKDDQCVATSSRRSQMSTARMNSIRRDVMGGGEDGASRRSNMKRAQSSSRITLDSEERASRKDKRADMRKSMSNPRLQLGGGADGGMKRTGSRRRLGSGQKLNASLSNLRLADGDEEGTDNGGSRQNARFGGPRRSGSRAKLNASKTGLSFDHTEEDNDDDNNQRAGGLSRRNSSRALDLGLKF